jgi:hypothetical protein
MEPPNAPIAPGSGGATARSNEITSVPDPLYWYWSKVMSSPLSVGKLDW